MNEKIKELALQAGGSHYPDVGGKLLEKFAELLIKECAGVTLDYTNEDHYTGWCDHSAEILTHFGVK